MKGKKKRNNNTIISMFVSYYKKHNNDIAFFTVIPWSSILVHSDTPNCNEELIQLTEFDKDWQFS